MVFRLDFLARHSIRTQILIGFLPAFLVIMLLMFSSYHSLSRLSDNVQALNELSRENTLFVQVEHDVLELQRNIMVYSYIGYSGILKKIERLQTRIEQTIGRIRPIARRNSQVLDRFQRLERHYLDYKEAFATAVEKRRENQAIKREQMQPVADQAHALTALLLEEYEQTRRFREAYLMQQIETSLSAVDNNWRSFEASPDATLIFKTNRLITQVRDDVGQLAAQDPANAEQLDELLALVEEYKTLFAKLINVNRVYMHLVNVVMAGKAAEIDALSDELDALVVKHSDAFRADITESVEVAQRTFVLFTLLAIAMGVVCAWLVAAGIARPVRAMANVLSRLARGEENTSVPAQERRDEIGRMASAANEFKTMALKVKEQNVAIKQSRAQLSAIVNNMNDGLIIINREGKIEDFNNACEVIFGYSAKEIMGKNVKMLMPEPYHSEHDGYMQHYNDTGEKRIIGIGREVEARRKNGEVFPIDLSVSEVDLGDRVIFSGIIRDITERKQAQDALVEANEELEEFAYRTSHDLRSPLVSAIGLLDMAEGAIDKGEREQAKDAVAISRGSLQKLETLVKDILALTATKKKAEEAQAVDVEAEVQEAMSKFTRMEGAENLEFRVDVACEQPVVVRKSRLVLILENLISNAIKYQDTQKSHSFVAIKARIEGEELLLSIEDNGLGVPKDRQKDMFVMFKRFHPRTSYGSGLGLYMMKKSAEVLKGTITYEDTGDGSRFTLRIPVQAEQE